MAALRPRRSRSSELAPNVAARLTTAYGGRADDVLQLAGASPELAALIDPELPYFWAEVVYAVRAEGARAVADVLRRRVPLFRDARDQGLAAAERVADVLAAELGWTPARRGRSLAAYEAEVERSRRWRAELVAAAPLTEP